MKVTVFGAGYVGLVTGACLAEFGNHVLCVDVDERKVAGLRAGVVPIHEPGLEPMIHRNSAAGRLTFTTNTRAAVEHGSIQMIAVGTPPDASGAADMRYVDAVSRDIAQCMQGYKVIVDKSTVPVGTADRVRRTVAAGLADRGSQGRDHEFSVVSNPEFLKEGDAIEDFMRPDRIVLGVDDERALRAMRELYAPFARNRDKLQIMDTSSAELTKYAANAMLATRISFMNELARYADRVGADIEAVRRGIGADPRIGTHFLYAGTGYGGSCFPKDMKALARAARASGVTLSVIEAADGANEVQKSILVDKVCRRFGERLDGRSFAVWGLAFKPDTDDLREAPSRLIVRGLIDRGAIVKAYDPLAGREAKRLFGDDARFQLVDHQDKALEGCDALLLVTEWGEFRSPDFAQMRTLLREKVVFDGRNLFDPAVVTAAGLEYHGIGRGRAQAAVRDPQRHSSA
jgi:UDPglucose 6-dehydrogenase